MVENENKIELVRKLATLALYSKALDNMIVWSNLEVKSYI